MATSFWEPVKNSKKILVEKSLPKSCKPKLESKFDENYNFISKFGDFFRKMGKSQNLGKEWKNGV
jgi:hypothetical protein